MSRWADGHGVQARALVLGRIEYRDSDLVLQMFTDELGRISALARGARKNSKRFSGSLEPMHTLRVEVSDRPKGELHTLKDARIEQARRHLTTHLEGLTTAGKALYWVKRAAPHHTPEPALWRAISILLDELNEPSDGASPDELLAGFGVRLLEVLGWGLHLVSCVSCAKPCPEGRAAWIHPERGGIICRTCGGGPLRLTGEARASMSKASERDGQRIGDVDAHDVLRVIDRSLSAHMGLDGRSTTDLGSRLK